MCIPLIFLVLTEFIVTILGCKDMGIRKSKFVVKAQFLYKKCLQKQTVKESTFKILITSLKKL